MTFLKFPPSIKPASIVDVAQYLEVMRASLNVGFSLDVSQELSTDAAIVNVREHELLQIPVISAEVNRVLEFGQLSRARGEENAKNGFFSLAVGVAHLGSINQMSAGFHAQLW